MPGVVRIFLHAQGVTKFTVLISLLLAGVAEGIGLAGLLPLLTVAIGNQGEQHSPIHDFVLQGLGWLGLSANIESLLLIVVSGIVIKSFLIFFAMRHVGYAVADVASNVRSTLIQRLLRVKWQYFTRQPVGRIANAVSLDATRSGEAYLMATRFIASVLQAVVYVTVALLVSWKLALMGVLAGSLLVLALRPLVRTAKNAGRRQRLRTEELVMFLSDALVSIKPLKAMARHEHFGQFFEKKLRSLRKALRRQALSQQLMKNAWEPILVVFLAGGFYVAQMALSISVAQLIVIGLLLQRMVSTLARVQEHLQNAVVVESAYWSVHNLIIEASGEREEFHGVLMPTLEKECALERVSFSFGDRIVLDDVSMAMPANHLTVITGASGIGKTTITDLLLGLHQPSNGRVLVDGVPLSDIDVESWRRMVGYVPQELTLFHDTVLSNVTLGDPSIAVDDAVAALKTAGAWEFVSALGSGCWTVIGERGIQLSGGQRQRIALARALVLNPRLLILDEVGSSLDPDTEEEIAQNIRSLVGSRTIVAITHRPVWVEIADRVYHLSPTGVNLVAAA